MPSPWEFGGLTWKELGGRVWRRAGKDDVIGRSAQLSYFFLFALFPLLFFLTSLLGYFTASGSELRESLLGYLRTVVPGKVHVLIQDTLVEITESSSGGKTFLGLLLAVWIASRGVDAIMSALNAAYGVKESRPWWKSQLIALGLTVAIAVLIVSALAVLLYGESVGALLAGGLGLGGAFSATWNVLQWPIVLAFVLLAFALVYCYAPNVEEIKWQWITPGSALGLSLWLLISYGFRMYIRYFDTYSTTYGSLGAVMILLLWLYLTGAAILLGGELNAVIENAAAEAGDPAAKKRGEMRTGDEEAGRGPAGRDENQTAASQTADGRP